MIYLYIIRHSDLIYLYILRLISMLVADACQYIASDVSQYVSIFRYDLVNMMLPILRYVLVYITFLKIGSIYMLVYIFRYVLVCIHIQICLMRWLRLVGCSKLQVSFAEYSLFYKALLQTRPIILRSVLIVATPWYI